jgi:hypothetical protein
LTVRVQLDSTRKSKEHGSTKVKACFATSRDLCDQFKQEDAEWKERDHVAEERQKQKQVETAEHECVVAHHASNHVFTGRMSSYKKNDFWALAMALRVSDKGTNTKLSSQIKGHLDQHPNLQSNPRFAGLFAKHTHTARNSDSTMPSDLGRDSEQANEDLSLPPVSCDPLQAPVLNSTTP